MRDGADLSATLPPPVEAVLARLADLGADAALVGGCVRDLVLGEKPGDWDVATSAPPEQVAAAFPGSTWTNPFGTVTVQGADGIRVEVTTFRIEGSYRDRRRPEAVRWGSSLAEDLARRDFTINAMAWRPTGDLGNGRLVDPYGGAIDLDRGILRAVGDPEERFAEDALRLVRAARFAARFGLRIEPATEAAIRRHAAAAASLSGERVRDELLRILGSDRAAPSAALLLLEKLGLLPVILPELAALRGIPQAKPLAGDALEHSLRAADALPATDPWLRMAGLLHDLGKATTLGDGHFIGHEEVGSELADGLLRRLHAPRARAARVVRLIRQHMFVYGPEWSDAAVRRFVRRVGADLLEDLFALRAADNAASGVREPASGGTDELRRRSAAAVAGAPLEARQLAVNGDDLCRELGLRPGPAIGALLDRLLEAVLDDPSLNEPPRLLARARSWAAETGTDAAAGDQMHHRDRRAETAER
jgi:tRNA nucleotidyltransferase (CCA-adding enzyme)